jgi:PKD repeat protein
MFAAAMLAAGLSSATYAQTCQAAFTYTVGSAGQVDFTNVSTGGGALTQYYWNFGDNSTLQQQTPSTHTYMYNGNYTVYLLMSDSLNGGGSCSSTYTAVIAINNTNTCNLAVSYTYSIGSNGQVSFANTSTGINAGMIVNWNFGDGNTSTQSSPSHTFAYNGSYGVNLSISDTMGYCVGSQFDTLVITNSQNPPSCNASFTYTLGANGLVDFSGSETGTITNPTYYWDFGDGGSTYGVNASHSYPYNGTFNVYFHATDSMNNAWTCTYMQQITISNSGGCPDSVYFYVGPDSAQAGNWNVYLYSNHYNSMMNAIWSWGDGTTSTGLFPSHTYSSPGMYSICATVYFACGDTVTYCQNDSVYRSASQMISVHVINTQSGVQDHVSSDVSLKAFPNPFSNELSVNLGAYENKEVICSLYDMVGNLVMKQNMQVTKGEFILKMRTSDLSDGVYFVRVTANDGTSSMLKVVK